jgi:hypothetical protein
MKKLILIIVLVGLAIHFKVVKAESVLSFTGKVVDTTVNVIGQVAGVVKDEVGSAKL